jgi:uracil-DNA glycosylase
MGAVRDMVVARLNGPDDFAGWRDAARPLAAAGVPPETVIWSWPGEDSSDLFAHAGAPPPTAAPDAAPPRAPRAFLELAAKAALHSDPSRYALLYRLLWRLQRQPGLIDDAADPDVVRLGDLARVVRRDIHKMRAFVRFRLVVDDDGTDHYVAWFEPDHHILRANAAFFVNRFANMRWSILTPQGSLHWDCKVLNEGPPAQRGDAPADDASEDLWRTYYASIFNPARLKIGAMLKEMPRRYWKNMPEAALIPELIAGAQAREAAMVRDGATRFTEARPATFAAIGEAIQSCTRCAIGCNGTRAVMGEGPDHTALMIVGEQPGDMEERAGRPFVGPAGQLLREHLSAARMDAAEIYVTNAVKHFKHEPQITPAGQKRRLHQTPSPREIDMCRWWIESERAIVKPQIILALGASAARAVLGRTVSVTRERGRVGELDDGSELWLAAHPSYLLRLDGAARDCETAQFQADLAAVSARVRELAHSRP